jgi:putative transposase
MNYLHVVQDFVRTSFVEWAKSKGIELRYIQPGKPNQNAFIERFNKSFRAEVLDAYLFNSLSEAQEVAEHWMMDYNEKRPHESLGNVPPTLYMPRCFNGRGL